MDWRESYMAPGQPEGLRTRTAAAPTRRWPNRKVGFRYIPGPSAMLAPTNRPTD